MAETLETIGKLLADDAQRDAVHIAVAPVICDDDYLYPGDVIGFTYPQNTTHVSCAGRGVEPVGIVDPYFGIKADGGRYHENIKRGERFWMFLFPHTVTSLRHHWTHPQFTPMELPPDPAMDPGKADAIRWLREYAESLDMSYGRLMGAAEEWLTRKEYHTLDFDTPSRTDTDAKAFWKRYELVTGREVEDYEANFFSCSC